MQRQTQHARDGDIDRAGHQRRRIFHCVAVDQVIPLTPVRGDPPPSPPRAPVPATSRRPTAPRAEAWPRGIQVASRSIASGRSSSFRGFVATLSSATIPTGASPAGFFSFFLMDFLPPSADTTPASELDFASVRTGRTSPSRTEVRIPTRDRSRSPRVTKDHPWREEAFASQRCPDFPGGRALARALSIALDIVQEIDGLRGHPTRRIHSAGQLVGRVQLGHPRLRRAFLTVG